MLKIDKKTYKVSIRKGDSGNIPMKFNIPIDMYKFWFTVKTHMDQPDSEAPILKIYDNVYGNYLVVILTEEDTDKLEVPEPCGCATNYHKDYIWAVKYTKKGSTDVHTLVPEGFKKPPTFRVYPEVIEGPHI